MQINRVNKKLHHFYQMQKKSVEKTYSLDKNLFNKVEIEGTYINIIKAMY